MSQTGRLRSVASFPIDDDNSGNDTRLSNKYWTLYVRAILDQGFDFEWWPGVELNHRHADFQSLLQVDLSYCLHYKK